MIQLAKPWVFAELFGGTKSEYMLEKCMFCLRPNQCPCQLNHCSSTRQPIWPETGGLAKRNKTGVLLINPCFPAFRPISRNRTYNAALCISIYLFLYLLTVLSTHRSIYRSIYRFVYRFIYRFIDLSTDLSICQSIYRFIYNIYLSNDLYLHICLHTHNMNSPSMVISCSIPSASKNYPCMAGLAHNVLGYTIILATLPTFLGPP